MICREAGPVCASARLCVCVCNICILMVFSFFSILFVSRKAVCLPPFFTQCLANQSRSNAMSTSLPALVSASTYVGVVVSRVPATGTPFPSLGVIVHVWVTESIAVSFGHGGRVAMMILWNTGSNVNMTNLHEYSIGVVYGMNDHQYDGDNTWEMIQTKDNSPVAVASVASSISPSVASITVTTSVASVALGNKNWWK